MKKRYSKIALWFAGIYFLFGSIVIIYANTCSTEWCYFSIFFATFPSYYIPEILFNIIQFPIDFYSPPIGDKVLIITFFEIIPMALNTLIVYSIFLLISKIPLKSIFKNIDAEVNRLMK